MSMETNVQLREERASFTGTIVTPESVSVVAFCFLDTMVEGVILSAVKRECIQLAQLLEWIFSFPFSRLHHLSKCPSKRETRTEAIDLEGRARSQEDEEGDILIYTINRHTCKSRQI